MIHFKSLWICCCLTNKVLSVSLTMIIKSETILNIMFQFTLFRSMYILPIWKQSWSCSTLICTAIYNDIIHRERKIREHQDGLGNFINSTKLLMLIGKCQIYPFLAIWWSNEKKSLNSNQNEITRDLWTQIRVRYLIGFHTEQYILISTRCKILPSSITLSPLLFLLAFPCTETHKLISIWKAHMIIGTDYK